MVDIEIIGPGGPIVVGALLDSGADRSLFNIAFADAVGIDLSKAKRGKMIGIGSTNKVYDVIKVEVRLKGFRDSIKIPVSFIDSESVVALMGQEGFFDAYRIKFEKDHKSFEITEPPKVRKKK